MTRGGRLSAKVVNPRMSDSQIAVWISSISPRRICPARILGEKTRHVPRRRRARPPRRDPVALGTGDPRPDPINVRSSHSSAVRAPYSPAASCLRTRPETEGDHSAPNTPGQGDLAQCGGSGRPRRSPRRNPVPMVKHALTRSLYALGSRARSCRPNGIGRAISAPPLLCLARLGCPFVADPPSLIKGSQEML